MVDGGREALGRGRVRCPSGGPACCRTGRRRARGAPSRGRRSVAGRSRRARASVPGGPGWGARRRAGRLGAAIRGGTVAGCAGSRQPASGDAGAVRAARSTTSRPSKVTAWVLKRVREELRGYPGSRGRSGSCAVSLWTHCADPSPPRARLWRTACRNLAHRWTRRSHAASTLSGRHSTSSSRSKEPTRRSPWRACTRVCGRGAACCTGSLTPRPGRRSGDAADLDRDRMDDRRRGPAREGRAGAVCALIGAGGSFEPGRVLEEGARLPTADRGK